MINKDKFLIKKINNKLTVKSVLNTNLYSKVETRLIRNRKLKKKEKKDVFSCTLLDEIDGPT